MSELDNLELRKLQLVKELEDINKKINEASVPTIKENIDWNPVVDLVKETIDWYRLGGFDNEDIPHYLYELVMTTVYGDEIFDWINERE